MSQNTFTLRLTLPRGVAAHVNIRMTEETNTDTEQANTLPATYDISSLAVEKHECDICAHPFVAPTTLPSCAHVFCLECITRWTQINRSCPMCRAPAYFTTTPVCEESRWHETPCPLDASCATRPLCKVASHVLTAHAEATCDECHEKMEERFMDDHVASECMYRDVPCPLEGCSAPVQVRLLLGNEEDAEFLHRHHACEALLTCATCHERFTTPESLGAHAATHPKAARARRGVTLTKKHTERQARATALAALAREREEMMMRHVAAAPRRDPEDTVEISEDYDEEATCEY